MRNGQPVAAVVHAQFECVACGAAMQRMSIAPLLPDGRVDMTHQCERLGSGVCPDCEEASRREENERLRRTRAARRWERKQRQMLKGGLHA